MYATCLFCHGSLGANQTIEAFPIGRRLAFDPAKGRLWVVCTKCGRWNLTPLEERWEAIEACERLFRAAVIRDSSPNIGLARSGDEVDLVRIGKPLRSEIASWKFVDAIRLRRRRAMIASAAASGVVVAAGLGFAVVTGTGASLIAANAAYNLWRWGKVLYSIRTPEGASLSIKVNQAGHQRWIPTVDSSPVGLDCGASVRLAGGAAAAVLRPVLAHLNRSVGTRDAVLQAVRFLEEQGDPVATTTGARRLYARLLERETQSPGPYRDWIRAQAMGRLDSGTPSGLLLNSFTPIERLALEIALGEDDERHVTNGELESLEVAWREAEEIAAIADNLFLPESVRAWMHSHGR